MDNVDQTARLVDDDGLRLCRPYLHNAKCKFGVKCQFSHKVPPTLRIEYEEKKRKELEIEKLNTAMKIAALQKQHEDAAVPAPSWIEELRREQVFSYDVERFPLAEAMAALLECSDVGELQEIHKRELESKVIPLNPRLIHSFRFGGRKLPTKWKRALMNEKQMISRMTRSEPYLNFMSLYRKFIKEVIVPIVGQPIQCQTPPTMRVAMPSRAASIHPHTDSEFENHVAAEINFWVPVTRVWGSNTLWLESKPGIGDFHPANLEYGQILRFNGNQCSHFTKANDTDATRISFDFRAIPLSEYRGCFDGKIGDYKSEHFQPGEE